MTQRTSARGRISGSPCSPSLPSPLLPEFPLTWPTRRELAMLALINRARANPLAEAARLGMGLDDGLPPGSISRGPLPPLAFSRFLTTAAREHSAWMLATGQFGHTGAGGSDSTIRIRDAGYPLGRSWRTGENISWTGNTGPLDLSAAIGEQHDGLMRSPVHRQNILSPYFREVGIGQAVGRHFSGGLPYAASFITQDFATSSASRPDFGPVPLTPDDGDLLLP